MFLDTTRTFLAAHWETVAATDFFPVEVATVRRPVTYYVLVVIELSSRKVHIAGITPGPDDPFMIQVGRNLTDLCLLFIHPRAPNLISLRSAGTMPA